VRKGETKILRQWLLMHLSSRPVKKPVFGWQMAEGAAVIKE
jgi:hypothetical protein